MMEQLLFKIIKGIDHYKVSLWIRRCTGINYDLLQNHAVHTENVTYNQHQ